MNALHNQPHVEGTAATVEGGITRPPMLPTEKTMELCRRIDEIGQEIGVDFGWTASGGGSDGSFSAAEGIPTIDGLGPVGGGAHSEGEYLEIDSIIPRYELLCRIIQHIVGLR
jgi:glutamate carboxypeptidase